MLLFSRKSDSRIVNVYSSVQLSVHLSVHLKLIPINLSYCTHLPSCISAIWSVFATLKPFGLFKLFNYRSFATLTFLHCVEIDHWSSLNHWLQWFDVTIEDIQNKNKAIKIISSFDKDIKIFKQNNKAFVR